MGREVLRYGRTSERRQRERARPRRRLGTLILIGLATLTLVAGAAPPEARADTPPALSVAGPDLRAAGTTITLRGINRSAFASCSGDAVYDPAFAPAPASDPQDDFADGPVDPWSVSVLRSWGVNAVRLVLNESCWLGEPTAADAASRQAPQPSRCETYAPNLCETAAGYRQAVAAYVDRLGQAGLYVILDLQYTAPPGVAATQIDHFPDAAHAPAFWQDVAQTFRADPWVVFDLVGEVGASPYNGPVYASGTYGDTPSDNGQNWTDTDIWNCWLHGCTNVPSSYTDGAGVPYTYTTAGIQSLIDAVRATGAENPVEIGSPDFALGYGEADCAPPGGSGSGTNACWPEHEPTDPAAQLIVDAHLFDYDFLNVPQNAQGQDVPTAQTEQTALNDAIQYLDGILVPIARTYPVTVGELGETDCQNPQAPFVGGVLDHLDALAGAGTPTNLSAFGWSWEANNDAGHTIETGWTCPTSGYGVGGPLLISDYDGTASPMGAVVKQWLLAHDPGAPPPPGPPNQPAPAPAPTTTDPASTAPTSTTPTAPTGPTSPTSPTPPPSTPPAPAPQALHAPSVRVTGHGTLTCTGARFAPPTGTGLTYAWYRNGARLTGAGASAPRLPLSRVSDALVRCAVTAIRPVTILSEATNLNATTTTTTSTTFPVPGRLLRRGSHVFLPVLCPPPAPGEGHTRRQSCQVSLRLGNAHGRTLARTALRLRAGARAVAPIPNPGGATHLVVTETVGGARVPVTVADEVI